MRRTAPLLAATALAAGLLSGCDFPAGTSPQLSYDSVPNNTQAEAGLVGTPRTITGSVGPHDTDDWFEIVSPVTSGQQLWEICESGSVQMSIHVEPLDAEESTDGTLECRHPVDDDLVANIFNVGPSDRVWVHIHRLPDVPFSPYSVSVEYRPAED